MEEETLEEAIDRISKKDGYDIDGCKVADFVDGMVKGAKWQQERSYSEEEVLKIIDRLFHMYSSDYRKEAKEWFEKFKKK